jgi:hypothetical protein
VKVASQKRQDWIRGRRQKRKLARQARLRRQIFRYTLLAAMVFAAVAGFSYLPWSISTTNPDITIHGNLVATNQQILSMLQPALGKPLYKVDPHEIENNICRLPIIKHAFVRRCVLPHPALRVEVMEEFPWATICDAPDGPANCVISQTGRIIPIAEFPRVVQPPLHICGMPALKLTASQIADWDRWVRLIAEQAGQPVDYVDMRQPSAIVVACGDLHLHIGQADSTLTTRLNRLASVAPVIATLKEKLTYVDLSLDSNIPLKIDRSNDKGRKDEELLKQAVSAGGSNADSTPLPL